MDKQKLLQLYPDYNKVYGPYGRDGKKYAEQNSIFNSLVNLCHAINVSGNLPRDIALPKIGCGLGGLDWDTDVEPVLWDVYKSFHINYIVCSI